MKRFLKSLKSAPERLKSRISRNALARRLAATPWLATPAGYIAEAAREWSRDGASRLAAALAYYTVFSLAPLLIIVIAVAGFFFGHSEARHEVLSEMEGLIGTGGTGYLRTLVDTTWEPASGIWATLIGVGVLLFGSTRAFAQLQEALNLIWGAPPLKGKGLWPRVRQRLLSFSLVLTIGFLLLVSLVLSASLSAAGKFFSGIIPSYFPLISLLNWLVSFGITVLLFAAIYKILPDVRIRWRNVWLGAAVAALLFSIGRYLIGLYLGRSSLGSIYGAAGSFVIILLWVYYSAQILFFGAEVTQVSARRHGRRFPGDPGYAQYARREQAVEARKHKQHASRPLTQEQAEEGG